MANTPYDLVGQLRAAETILVENAWLRPEQYSTALERAAEVGDIVPAAGRSILAQWLVQCRLINREQAIELDSVQRQQEQLPEFVLLRKLGSGGMGTVYLARAKDGTDLVALKTMNAKLADDKDFVNRFHREAKALSKLRHPNVAGILGHGERDGVCWLAMEYIQGDSLMAVLRTHRVLPETYALRLVRQVADGLGHAWSAAQLIHRDIKPENILVVRAGARIEDWDDEDRAMLIDFGLVKSNRDDERLTQTGMTIGTPLYMSPEQVRGEALDNRSDIYGLGATLYHLLTGATPYNGSSPGSIMSAHLTEAVPDPGLRVPSLSQATRSLVMMSMAKMASDRFTTCAGFSAACDEAINILHTHATERPNFLRKPMVITPPVRKTSERTPAVNVALPEIQYNPDTASGTDRARRASGVVRAPTTERPATTRAQASGSGRPAATKERSSGSDRPAVVRQASSDRFSKSKPNLEPQTSRSGRRPATEPLERKPPVGLVPPPLPKASAQDLAASAAFRDDGGPAGGVGMLPWLALAAAVLALTGYLAFNYL